MAHFPARCRDSDQMTRFGTAPTYIALRLDPDAQEWLAAARLRAFEAPDSVRTLLAGRSRVEVDSAESERALAWAEQLRGWSDDGRPPLVRYSPGDRHVGA